MVSVDEEWLATLLKSGQNISREKYEKLIDFIAADNHIDDNSRAELREKYDSPQVQERLRAIKNLFRSPFERNIKLPFFAYGLFRVGQLGFLRIKDSVEQHDKAYMNGEIVIRDGIPLLTSTDSDTRTVAGDVFWFYPEKCQKAYESIQSIEPENQYCWKENTTTDGIKVNVLVGKDISKGAHIMDIPWNGQNDPFFVEVIDNVDEVLKRCLPVDSMGNGSSNKAVRNFLDLQMAYMLLWTAIERYATLRYNIGDGTPMKNMGKVAEEPAFSEAIRRHVKIDGSSAGRKTTLYRADNPQEKVVLDVSRPKKAIDYYYQLRCNITHRGKALLEDYYTLRISTQELRNIFVDIKNQAFEEAH